MNKRRWILLCFCVVCVAGAVYAAFNGAVESPIFALSLPFVWIGRLLRRLSLSSGLGNVFAILLYVGLSLLPCIPTALRVGKKKGSFGGAEWLSLLLSGYSFYAFYYFVNPQLMYNLFGAFGEEAGAIALTLCYLSLLVAYIVLRVMREETKKPLEQNLKRLCLLCTALFLFSLCFSDLYALLSSMLPTAESGLIIEGENLSWWQKQQISAALGFGGNVEGVYVLRFITSIIPKILMLRLFMPAYALLCGMQGESYSEANANLAAQVAKRARAALFATVCCCAGWNLLQLIFVKELPDINFSVEIPFFGMLLALLALYLSQHYAESCRIYRENQEFV